MKVCCKHFESRIIMRVFLDSEIFTMSISQEGREKAEEDCKGRIISCVFSNQLKAESLSGWQGFIASWNHWELQKIFVTSTLHKNHSCKDHLNYSTDSSREDKILWCFSDLCARVKQERSFKTVFQESKNVTESGVCPLDSCIPSASSTHPFWVT